MGDKWLKLPFNFDVDRLETDLKTAGQYKWIDHVNTRIYEGQWRAIPLRAVDGRIDNIAAVSTDAKEYKNTEALDRCPFFQEVINTMKCETTAVRLLSMGPGAKIKRHDDYPCGFKSGHARLHVPIMTNPDVKIFIADGPVFFGEGECWYMNAEYPHSLENLGDSPRVHLVIDCIVNPWLETIFTEAGYTEPVVNHKYGDPSINDENVALIIAELERDGDPVKLEMATKLRNLSLAG